MHPGLVEPAPVAYHCRLAQRLGLFPPARVLVGDEVAGVDMAPDLARVGLGLRRRRGRAEVGALDKGELAKLLRLLVLFAEVRHQRHSMEAKRSIIDYLADHARRSPDAPVV